MQTIPDFPKWWAFFKYYGFKYHVNITEGLETFAEESIRFGKEDVGTSAFDQYYNKLQAKKDRDQTQGVLSCHP